MKNYFKLIRSMAIIGLISLTMQACDFISGGTDDREKDTPTVQKSDKKYTGTREVKFDNGKIKTRVEYVDGKRHGSAIQYYPTGKVHLSDTYIHGKRDGVSKYYYQDGAIYRETDYHNGMRDGWVKEYHTNGQIKYKAGYANDEATGEFIAYDASGSPKPQPEMTFKELGWNATHDKYRWQVSFKKNRRNARYYLSPKGKSDEFNYAESRAALVKDGVGTFVLDVPKGTYLDLDVVIRGEFSNRFKYPMQVNMNRHLHVENP